MSNHFNLQQWEQSLKYINPSDLNIPQYEYEVYKESQHIPKHIRYACFYLSIVDKALIEWWGSTSGHPMKPLGLPVYKENLLEGYFRPRITLDCLSVNLGGFVWK
jgi:hypothetical protein